MSRNPDTDSSTVGFGWAGIDPLETDQTFSYWVSRAIGYAALGLGIVLGIGSIF